MTHDVVKYGCMVALTTPTLGAATNGGADDAVAAGDRWTVRAATAGVKTAGGTKSRSRLPLTLEAER